MRSWLMSVAVSLSIVFSTTGAVRAAGTEPEPTVVEPAKPAECTEADKTKCPPPSLPVVECKEADKTKCPPAIEPKKQSFIDSYRAAVALIEAERYDEALSAMRALDDGTSADVVNYIGFIHRKLGRMAEAQMYYEAALHMKPDHRGALEYYGEWYVMMGQVEQARKNLARIALLYGSDTKEYAALAKMIHEAQSS